ncbi:hypothetical protein Tco_0174944 [Tanacetum coccineum]
MLTTPLQFCLLVLTRWKTPKAHLGLVGDTKGVDEVDEESAESKKEVEEEEEEEEDNPKYFDTFPTVKELGYHEWLLKNPRLPWVNLRLNYYWIMSEGLKQCSKRHAFAATKAVLWCNFTYECDFVIVEDTTSVIDHYLGGMVLQKPFVKESSLIYGKDEGDGLH